MSESSFTPDLTPRKSFDDDMAGDEKRVLIDVEDRPYATMGTMNEGSEMTQRVRSNETNEIIQEGGEPPRESFDYVSRKHTKNMTIDMAGDVKREVVDDVNNPFAVLTTMNEVSELIQKNRSNEGETKKMTELIQEGGELPRESFNDISRKHTKSMTIDMAGDVKREVVDEEKAALLFTGNDMSDLLQRGDLRRNDPFQDESRDLTKDKREVISQTASLSSKTSESSLTNETSSDLASPETKEYEAELRFNRIRPVPSSTGSSAVGDIEADHGKDSSFLTEPTIDSYGDEAYFSKLKKYSKDDSCGNYCLRNRKMMIRAGILTFIVFFSLVATLGARYAKENSALTLGLTTFAPSVSSAPSGTPSVSLQPSSVPSEVPSGSPSLSSKPSDSPSAVPSNTQVPSASPSSVPSLVPSETPSRAPSVRPSLSLVPSSQPSSEPSMSWEPTFSPISRNRDFKLRLYWEKGYKWQEDPSEKFWCVECANCTDIGRDDGSDHGCQSYSSGRASKCRNGDLFWVRDCRSRGARFNVIQRRDERGRDIGYQLRLDGRSLCIERRNVYLLAKGCDSKNKNQLWAPWGDMNKFQIRPYKHQDLPEEESLCISQTHHPKNKEVIGMHNCADQRRYKTLYWEDY